MNQLARLLKNAGYKQRDNPAIAALLVFALRGPGLCADNYTDLNRFNKDKRRIQNDLRHFKAALKQAAKAGVTDKVVVGLSNWPSHCRLKYMPGNGWHYQPVQHYANEYRRAATLLLLKAISAKDAFEEIPCEAHGNGYPAR